MNMNLKIRNSNYMKLYIKFLFGFIFLCAPSQAMDDQAAREKALESGAPVHIEFKTQKVEVTNISTEVNGLKFRSITIGDAGKIAELVNLCGFKEGLPENPEKGWADNLLTRHFVTPNPYTGLLIFKDDKPVGFLTTGVMPAVGFLPGYILEKHPTIIKTFIGFGAIRLKEKPDVENPTHAPQVYEQVEDGGLGMLLPVLPRQLLSESEIRTALNVGVAAFQNLRDQGKKLPRVNTSPDKVMGLFHPDDPLIKDLEAVGFMILRDKGLFEFYEKDRVLALKHLKKQII
jgi:hypothetical protein